MATDREPTPLVGRHHERALLDDAVESARAEFVAIYGRQRIGKTFLVRQHVRPAVDHYCEVVGRRGATLAVQLHHMARALERAFGGGVPRLASWSGAMDRICDEVEARPGQRVAVFLDELPWLATPRSGLLQTLDHAWNARLSQCPNLTLVVSGSAASWIVSRLIQARGGLHNRITRQIPLAPFTLPEARELLRARGSAMACSRPSWIERSPRGSHAAVSRCWWLEQVGTPAHAPCRARPARRSGGPDRPPVRSRRRHRDAV